MLTSVMVTAGQSNVLCSQHLCILPEQDLLHLVYAKVEHATKLSFYNCFLGLYDAYADVSGVVIESLRIGRT